MRYFLSSQASKDLRYNLMQWLLIMRVESAIVLLLQKLLCHIQVDCHFLILLELHDQERISRLSLSQRRVEANADHMVKVVGLGKNHEFLNIVVLDFVIVCLATQTE